MRLLASILAAACAVLSIPLVASLLGPEYQGSILTPELEQAYDSYIFQIVKIS